MRMPYKLFFLCSWLTLCGHLYAQQLFPQTVSTAGQSYSQGTVLLESSTGGVAVASPGIGSLLLSQGFLQPFAGIAGSVPDVGAPVLSSAGPDNAGTTFSTGNTTLEFTVGEVASITRSGAGYMLTPGILQPYRFEPPLPVTLADFQAKRSETDFTLVTWATVEEIDNDGFVVERRLSHEADFTPAGFVDAAAPGGYSKGLLKYTFRDYNPFSGISYYRLKQVDIDGTISYSVIRSVNGVRNAGVSLKAWPVPSDGHVQVEMSGAERDMLLVYDLNGKLIRQLSISGNRAQPIDGLRSGIYLLRLAEQKTGTRVIVR